MTNSLNQIR